MAPLAELPRRTPPDVAVHQLIVLPADVALRFELCPAHIVAGVAVTAVGADGSGLIVTTLLALAVQPVAGVVTVTVYVPLAETVIAAVIADPPVAFHR